MSEGSASRRTTIALRVVVLLLLVRLALLLATGPINEDELEVLQVGWLLDHGELFYRDYVYPHLPTLPLMLLPLLRAMGPGLEVAEAARWLGAPALAATLLATAALARRLASDARAGWIAVALLIASPRVAATLCEMRGDVFALPLVLGGLVAFGAHVSARAVGRFGWAAAALLGGSALFNQKGIFVALAILAAADRWHRDALGLDHRARARWVAGFVALGAAPVALVLAALGVAGLLDGPTLVLVATTGQWVLDASFFASYKAYVLLCTVALIPVPWIAGLASAARRLGPGKGGATDPLARALALGLVASVLYLAVQPIHTMQLPVLPLALASVLAAPALLRLRPAALLAALAFTLVLPALHRPPGVEDRAEQRARMRWVLERVPPGRPVIDGRLGLESFHPLVAAPPRSRLQQYRPWVYAPGFRAVHEAAVLRAIAGGRAGAVILHPGFELLPPEVRRLVHRNYEASERPDVLLPRPRP